MFQTFDLPEPVPTPAQLDTRLQAQYDVLAAPMTALVDGMYGATLTNSKLVNTVTKRCKQSCVSRCNKDVQALSQVVGKLLQAVAELVSQQAALIQFWRDSHESLVVRGDVNNGNVPALADYQPPPIGTVLPNGYYVTPVGYVGPQGQSGGALTPDMAGIPATVYQNGSTPIPGIGYSYTWQQRYPDGIPPGPYHWQVGPDGQYPVPDAVQPSNPVSQEWSIPSVLPVAPEGDSAVVNVVPDGPAATFKAESCPVNVTVRVVSDNVKGQHVPSASDSQPTIDVGADSADVGPKSPVIMVAAGGGERPDPTGATDWPDFGDAKVCDTIGALNARAKEICKDYTPIELQPFVVGDDFDFEAWWEGNFKTRLPWFDGIVKPLAEDLISLITFVVNPSLSSASCDTSKVAPVAILRSILAFAGRIFPGLLDDKVKALGYWLHTQCPSTLPSAGDSLQAFLADKIDYAQLKCWATANGMHWEPFTKVAEANETRLSNSQAVTADMREIIPGGAVIDMLRANGVVDGPTKKYLLELAKYWPGPQDLIRFMVRDVFDEDVVTDLGLDKEFDDKFTGRAEKVAKGQGIDRETAKLFWRAHWQLISPTQIFTMLHRLRPNEVADDVAVTPAMAERWLGIADYPPAFRKRLMAISYNVRRLIDIRRDFLDGISSVVVAEADLKDRGYTQKDADKTLASWRNARFNYWITKGEVKTYLAGTTSEAELVAFMARTKLKADEREELLEHIKQTGVEQTRAACNKALHRDYLLGQYSVDGLRNMMTQWGYPVEQQERIVNRWECQAKARKPHAAASQLCRWTTDGLLSLKDMVARLKLLGYDDDDVQRIVATCQLRQQERINSATVKAAKQQQAAAEKAQRLLDAQARKVDAARVKAQKAKEAKAKAAAKAKADRDKAKAKASADATKAELGAAKKLAASAVLAASVTGMPLDTERQSVERVYHSLLAVNKLTTDKALVVIADAIQSARLAESNDWESLVPALVAIVTVE